MKVAQMDMSVSSFVFKCIFLAIIFSINVSLMFFFFLGSIGATLLIIPISFLFLIIFFLLFLRIPKAYQARIRREIESDIFTPSGMLITLLESGNSIVSALEGVGATKAKSGKYFEQIASEVYLGKNITQAIDDAIKYTPSDSFRRVLEPIKKALKTGTDVQRNLKLTLKELSQEKIVETVEYEKKLNSISMLYMIFGTIIPAVLVVAFVLVMSMLGIKVEFFPFLLIILVFIFFLQVIFINIFQSIRPLVKL